MDTLHWYHFRRGLRRLGRRAGRFRVSSGLARPAAGSLHTPHGSARHRRRFPQSICPSSRPSRRCRSSSVRPSRLVVCRRRYRPPLSALSVRPCGFCIMEQRNKLVATSSSFLYSGLCDASRAMHEPSKHVSGGPLRFREVAQWLVHTC